MIGPVRCAAALWLLCAVLLPVAERATAAEAPFGFPHVVEKARTLAGRGFTPPPAVPELWQKVGYDQHRDIDFDRGRALWKDSGNFRVELIHPGNVYKPTVAFNTYDRAGLRPVPFSPDPSRYGKG